MQNFEADFLCKVNLKIPNSGKIQQNDGPQGLDWQDLWSGPLDIVTYQIHKLWTSQFQRGRFFHYKSMRAICCHSNQSYNNEPKKLMQPSAWALPDDALLKI